MTRHVMTTLLCFVLILACADKVAGVNTILLNLAESSTGGQRFNEVMVKEYDAKVMMQDFADKVVRFLYPNGGEPYDTVIFYVYAHLLPNDDIAVRRFDPLKKIAEIYLSAALLAARLAEIGNKNMYKYLQVKEIREIMYLQVAIVLENNIGGAAPPGYLTGLAYFIGLESKAFVTNRVERGSASPWDQGNQYTADFLRYLNEHVQSGSVIKLNQLLKYEQFSPLIFWHIFEKSFETLWGEYKRFWRQQPGRPGY